MSGVDKGKAHGSIADASAQGQTIVASAPEEACGPDEISRFIEEELAETDDWDAAIGSITEMPNPSARLLAILLRGDDPIPASVRIRLAELLDPESAPIFGRKLEITDYNKYIDSKPAREICLKYKEKRKNGKTSEEAVFEIAEEFNISERTVYRYVKTVNKDENDWISFIRELLGLATASGH